jgi:hypothetical protein
MDDLEPRANGEGGSPEPPVNGWKEIAAHFGKGVRTVQRWERDMGLPVHRLPGPRGEIVFAFPSELRAWWKHLDRGPKGGEEDDTARNTALDPAADDPGAEREVPGRFVSRRWLVAAGLVVALGSLLAVVFNLGFAWRERRLRGPAGLEVRGNALVALDEQGKVLWSHRFEDPLEASAVPMAFGDIDGDRRVETLFFAVHVAPVGSVFYCFESDGRVRFRRTLESRHTYGDEAFGPPWRGHRLVNHPATLRSGEIWIVWIHSIEFPSVLQKLDAQGRLLGEYWNAGYIQTVVPVVRGRRRLILAGGNSNESKAGFLAVLDPNRPSGSSPGVDSSYSCRDCPAGAAERYFVFPRLDVAREVGDLALVSRLEPDETGHTMIGVQQTGNPLTSTWYRLGPGFTVIRAEVSPEFAGLHQQFEQQHRLRHHLGDTDERELRNVLEWDGRQFGPLSVARTTPARSTPAGLSR